MSKGNRRQAHWKLGSNPWTQEEAIREWTAKKTRQRVTGGWGRGFLANFVRLGLGKGDIGSSRNLVRPEEYSTCRRCGGEEDGEEHASFCCEEVGRPLWAGKRDNDPVGGDHGLCIRRIRYAWRRSCPSRSHKCPVRID